MSWQYRGLITKRPDRDAEWQAGARWVETRNGTPVTVPYVWRGERSRFAALTRARVELALAADPDE